MENFIIIGIVALIIAAALFYIIRAKKRGVKCIGCAAADKCGGNCGSCNIKK